jgi:hypothetical protein
MTCEPWRDLLVHEGLDEMSEARREEYLLHLESCPPCRRAAVLIDPTVAFSLLPTESVREAEVEEIRRTVRALRRSRTLGAPRPSGWLTASALAAMIAVVILLVPERSISLSPEEIPFAGAVGVGSGLVEIPRTAAASPAVRLQIVLARSAKMVDLSRSPSLVPIGQTGLVALPGDLVEADLDGGFRIRFDLPEEPVSGGPLLRNFELLQGRDHREVSLLRADLRPRPGSPLILGINPLQPGSEQLWLHLTSTVDRPTVQTSER